MKVGTKLNRDYRDHYGARWPHMALFLAHIKRQQDVSAAALCREFGISNVTFGFWVHSGRYSFATLKAAVQRYGDEKWAKQLRDSAVVDHTLKGFTVTTKIETLARAFDVEHLDYQYAMKGGGLLTARSTAPADAQETHETHETHETLAHEPVVTAAAGGNAAPPAPDNADSTRASQPVGEVSAPSRQLPALPASVTVDLPVPPEAPAAPLGEVEALVTIAAKLIRERDHYAAQLAIQRMRFEQEKAELQRAAEGNGRIIRDLNAEIVKLKADIAEWQQLAEREPETKDVAPITPVAEARIAKAISSNKTLNGAGDSLLDELARLPKAPGHGR